MFFPRWQKFQGASLFMPSLCFLFLPCPFIGIHQAHLKKWKVEPAFSERTRKSCACVVNAESGGKLIHNNSICPRDLLNFIGNLILNCSSVRDSVSVKTEEESYIFHLFYCYCSSKGDHCCACKIGESNIGNYNNHLTYWTDKNDF